MAILEIKIYPEPVLKKKAEPVLKITDAEKKLIEDMIETLPLVNGVGLAAPQVGISKRIAVIKDIEQDKTVALINPVLIKRSGRAMAQEGCLSLPGLYFNIKRWKEVAVEYLDVNGKCIVLESRDMLARIIQHEMDHLNGMLLVDKLNFFKRRAALKNFNKKR